MRGCPSSVRRVTSSAGVAPSGAPTTRGRGPRARERRGEEGGAGDRREREQEAGEGTQGCRGRLGVLLQIEEHPRPARAPGLLRGSAQLVLADGDERGIGGLEEGATDQA